MNIWMLIVCLANWVFISLGLFKKILTVKQISYCELYVVVFCFIVWIRSGYYDEFFIYLLIHLFFLLFIQILIKPNNIEDNK